MVLVALGAILLGFLLIAWFLWRADRVMDQHVGRLETSSADRR